MGNICAASERDIAGHVGVKVGAQASGFAGGGCNGDGGGGGGGEGALRGSWRPKTASRMTCCRFSTWTKASGN